MRSVLKRCSAQMLGLPWGALTTQLSLGVPERSVAVSASWCAAELENSNGIVTVQRAVKNSRVQPNLVRVWRGPAITDGERAGRQEEFFVRESGSAKNPRGFHRFLADYLDWQLPMIPRYTGGESPLYPEIIFPFLYADQRSWGSAGPGQLLSTNYANLLGALPSFSWHSRAPKLPPGGIDWKIRSRSCAVSGAESSRPWKQLRQRSADE